MIADLCFLGFMLLGIEAASDTDHPRSQATALLGADLLADTCYPVRETWKPEPARTAASQPAPCRVIGGADNPLQIPLTTICAP